MDPDKHGSVESGDGNGICIEITDNGMGMEEDKTMRIEEAIREEKMPGKQLRVGMCTETEAILRSPMHYVPGK